MDNVEFKVRNVRCGGCVSTIKSSLGVLAGVHTVDVDIPTGRVRVQGENLVADQLAAKTAELGYPRV